MLFERYFKIFIHLVGRGGVCLNEKLGILAELEATFKKINGAIEARARYARPGTQDALWLQDAPLPKPGSGASHPLEGCGYFPESFGRH